MAPSLGVHNQLSGCDESRPQSSPWVMKALVILLVFFALLFVVGCQPPRGPRSFPMPSTTVGEAHRVIDAGGGSPQSTGSVSSPATIISPEYTEAFLMAFAQEEILKAHHAWVKEDFLNLSQLYQGLPPNCLVSQGDSQVEFLFCSRHFSEIRLSWHGKVEAELEGKDEGNWFIRTRLSEVNSGIQYRAEGGLVNMDIRHAWEWRSVPRSSWARDEEDKLAGEGGLTWGERSLNSPQFQLQYRWELSRKDGDWWAKMSGTYLVRQGASMIHSARFLLKSWRLGVGESGTLGSCSGQAQSFGSPPHQRLRLNQDFDWSADWTVPRRHVSGGVFFDWQKGVTWSSIQPFSYPSSSPQISLNLCSADLDETRLLVPLSWELILRR